MIDIIDVDGLFDKFVSDFVRSELGRVKPEEIEDKIPLYFDKFRKTEFAELGGKTPETFYDGYTSEELLTCLEEHIKRGIPVSDFLFESITRSPDCETAAAAALNAENQEEFTMYLMNILAEKNSDKALNRYLEFILWDYTEPVRELATELLCGFADKVRESIISQFADADAVKKECLAEILSYASHDDRVFDILIEQFVLNADKMPLYLGYLVRYGDERALPYLYTAVEGDRIDYADYKELLIAIEALGGEYKGERDFSSDKVYKRIKREEEKFGRKKR